jgi:hypothetical protein
MASKVADDSKRSLLRMIAALPVLAMVHVGLLSEV